MRLLLLMCFAFTCGAVYSDIFEECKKYECPKFEVIEKKNGYEIRKYPAYKIAVAKSDNVKGFVKSRQKNYFKLYRYQQGNNENHHSLPMVYPFVSLFNVKTWSTGGEEKEEVLDEKFEMFFYLPKSLENPPKPLDDSIEIRDVPERIEYAVSSQGHANPKGIKVLQEKLRDALISSGVNFDRTKFGVMEYKRLDILWGRHFDVVYSETIDECKNFECAKVVSIKKKEIYEIRKYPAYKIAVVKSDNIKGFLKARKKNFFKLYRYQQGSNENHHSFPMVYPFVTVFNVKTWSAGEEVKEQVLDDKFGMFFYLPKTLTVAPKPLDSSIEIKSVPERVVYAISSPGYPNPTKIMAMREKLRDALTKAGTNFDRSKFGVMEYNRFDLLWGRRFDVVYRETKSE